MRMIKEPSCDEAAGAGSTRAADWGQIPGRGVAFVAHCRLKMLAVQIWVLAPG